MAGGIGIRARIAREQSNPTGCWVWPNPQASGYATTTCAELYGRRSVAVHRIAYELLVGPVPAGMDLDHLCRNRACFNPRHLEPVSHHENVLRGHAGENMRSKTHCPRGHQYDVTRPDGRRACRRCLADAQRRYRVRNRVEPAPKQKPTHCRNGHPIAPETTAADVGDGYRRCKVCRRDGTRRWRAKG